MSVKRIEKSRTAGIPFELFQFVYGEGAGDIFAYTDAERPLALAGDTYTPTAISRAAIKSKGRQKDTEMEIIVPRSSGVAGLFRGAAPRRVIFVRVYAGFLPGADVPTDWSEYAATANLIWAGRILQSTTKDNQVSLTCDTLGAGMKRPGLMRFYQRECSFVLYGPRCQANKAAATFPAQIAEVGPRRLTISGTEWRGVRAEVDFIGGLLEWNGEYGRETRMITAVSEGVITLDGPAGELEIGDSVDVILGCPRVVASCISLHDNILNYGGTPYIPLSNPINKNNHT